MMRNVTLLVGILVCGCGGSNEPSWPGAAGATHTGSGGSETGGDQNGSAASGGSSDGGTATSSGGSATGGSTNESGGTGGNSSGGSATGGSGGWGNVECPDWPTATGTQSVSSTISVSSSYDGKLKRFVGSGDLGTSGQTESQLPIFELAKGAVLKNVIIGSPAADGIHCLGSCTLQNVWWEDVGEDAATLKGSSSSQVMTVDCGGAKNAADKVFQHNGAGTMIIKNFSVADFGKLYRSCGNCSTQYQRHAEFSGITAQRGSALAGVNANYGDTARFSNILISGTTICQRYTGNDTGAEPVFLGSGADGTNCIYSNSDIHGF